MKRSEKPDYYKLVICKVKNSESPVLCWRAGTENEDLWTISGTDYLIPEKEILSWVYFSPNAQQEGKEVKVKPPFDGYVLISESGLPKSEGLYKIIFENGYNPEAYFKNGYFSEHPSGDSLIQYKIKGYIKSE